MRYHHLVGGAVILLFLALLGIRLSLLDRGEAALPGQPAFLSQRTGREVWMVVRQQGEKIGYVRRQYSPTAEGWRMVESSLMQMNMMGMVQEVRFRTEGIFKPDLSLSSFDFGLQSSLFRFKVRGFADGSRLTLFTGETGSETRFSIPLEKEMVLPISLLEVLTARELKPGDSRMLHLFDPATLTQRSVRVDVLSEDTVTVMGREEVGIKVSVDFMGTYQFAWIGRDGSILKEEGPLGLELERATREQALEKTAGTGVKDLAEIASVPVNKAIVRPEELTVLELRLTGIQTEGLPLHGGRQSLQGDRLTIRKESTSILRTPLRDEKRDSPLREWMAPTPLIQSDHSEIQAKVREIVSPRDSDWTKALKLFRWVHGNIAKRPVLSVPNALETLRHRVGDCNEHAVLLAALARAAGIPGQVEAGLVYVKGRFYYHAWNVLYVGTWITADATMGQWPADVTHVRFVQGTEGQIGLMGVLGKLRLEILESS